MKLWIAALAVWYVALGAGYLVVRDVQSATDSSQPDWEMVAVCVWERWDETLTFEQTGRILRYCVTVDPHSLPPSMAPESRG